MDSALSPHQTSLFQVYLRLRPPPCAQSDTQATKTERNLVIESPVPSETAEDDTKKIPTHITLQPPNGSRKRAVERFGFTRVFDEDSSQLDVFQDIGMGSLIKGVLQEGRDGLVATLGVTGSGKSHTILGSKSQRGITQMSLDVLFRSLASSVKNRDNSISPAQLSSLAASDPAESQLFSAKVFLDAVHGDSNGDNGRGSRAQTPVNSSRAQTPMTYLFHGRSAQNAYSLASILGSSHADWIANIWTYMKEPTPALLFPRRYIVRRPSTLPRLPDVSHIIFDLNPSSEYIVLVSMYEVYNDRIFDLLSPSIMAGQISTMSRQGGSQKDRRRPLLFKPTESSPDRKVVAGLRKIACATYDEALAVLDVGLTERKVTGTNSNSVSSRSHGFFCLEVKKKKKRKESGDEYWVGNTLTVVDLAGSERARAAKTAGATLAEAGKINESLMYLGQCLQMQSGLQEGNRITLVPFRQCKLTELLFSNSFLPPNQASQQRRPQKALMVVTADPLGDFNATSQILRYSALAREVTIPRVPSISDTILSSSSSSRGQANGRISAASASSEQLDRALAEVARLTEECHTISIKLAEEEILREELQARLRVAEERYVMIEQEVREECWAEMEEEVDMERRRWQSAWDEQTGRNDEHLNKKIEVLSRSFLIYRDPEPPSDEHIKHLELENYQLRSKIMALECELTNTSPTKRSRARNALEPSSSSNILSRESDIEIALSRMDQLKVTDSLFPPQCGTTGKKQRNTSTRRRDSAPDDEV